MSRSQTRARNRCARLNAILDRIEFAKSAAERMDAIEAVEGFLAKVEAAGGQVWPFLKQIEGRYPPDKYGNEERMVADLVAPWLSGSARGSVNHRYYFAKETPQNQGRSPKPY
jgi:hypothetical protein